jgi:AcrR family transcriptional regulator
MGAAKTAAQAAQPKPSFKQQMLLAREEAIVDVVNRMLADKGFDAMTVDEVAAEVGVAKASLYKHFPSKEDLAAAAMVRMMQRAHDFLGTISSRLSAIDKLKAAARWMMALKLAGEMPNLPSQNSSLDRGGAKGRAHQRQAARCGGAVHPVRPRLRSGAGVSKSHWSVQPCANARLRYQHLF